MGSADDNSSSYHQLVDWNEALRDTIATDLGLSLTPLHCAIIDLAREYYSKHHRLPAMRVWVKVCQKLDPTLDSLKLHQMFLEKPLRVISKLGGLPKPLHCI
jgi:tRNA 2-thiouridine synthesizing protein E